MKTDSIFWKLKTRYQKKVHIKMKNYFNNFNNQEIHSIASYHLKMMKKDYLQHNYQIQYNNLLKKNKMEVKNSWLLKTNNLQKDLAQNLNSNQLHNQQKQKKCFNFSKMKKVILLIKETTKLSQIRNLNDLNVQDIIYIRNYRKEQHAIIQQKIRKEIKLHKQTLLKPVKLSKSLQKKWLNARRRLKIIIIFAIVINKLKTYGTQIHYHQVRSTFIYQTPKANNLQAISLKKVSKFFYSYLDQFIAFYKLVIRNFEIIVLYYYIFFQPIWIKYLTVNSNRMNMDIIFFVFTIFRTFSIIKDDHNRVIAKIIYLVFDAIQSYPYSIQIYYLYQEEQAGQSCKSQEFMVFQYLQWMAVYKCLYGLYVTDNHHIITAFKDIGISNSKIQLLFVWVLVLSFSHVAACLFLHIGYMNLDCQTNWLSPLLPQSALVLYFRSMYLIVQTITTVGYGDRTPQNISEYSFSMVLMIFGGFLYSYVISNIMNSFTKFSTKKQSLNYKLIVMEKFSDSSNLSDSLKKRIKNQLNYNSKKGISNSYEMNQLINIFPQFIKQQINKNIQKKNQHQQFFKDQDETFIYETIQFLQPCRFQKGDYIYKKCQYPMNIYLVEKGKVGFHCFDRVFFKQFVAKSYFGEIELIKNQEFKYNRQKNIQKDFEERIFSCVAIMDSALLALSEDDFLKLMTMFPKQYLQLKMMAIIREKFFFYSALKVKKFSRLGPYTQFWKSDVNFQLYQHIKDARYDLENFSHQNSQMDSNRFSKKSYASKESHLSENFNQYEQNNAQNDEYLKSIRKRASITSNPDQDNQPEHDDFEDIFDDVQQDFSIKVMINKKMIKQNEHVSRIFSRLQKNSIFAQKLENSIKDLKNNLQAINQIRSSYIVQSKAVITLENQ